jgi:hypothetical protein
MSNASKIQPKCVTRARLAAPLELFVQSLDRIRRADRFQLDGNLGNLSQAEHLEGGAGLTE